MSIKDKYKVQSIKAELVKEWFLKKHYAHRVPSISFCFSLLDENNIIVGVCSFGVPPNYVEMRAWEPYELLELNRLVTNDNLERNATSYFVSKCLSMLPKPKVIISYADLQKGHHGYIYQATNWIYTGIGGIGNKIYIMKDGSERHQRHENKIDPELIDKIETTTGKARYYYFVADKRTKRKLNAKLRYKKLPYPKGDNKKYDASYSPSVQKSLF